MNLPKKWEAIASDPAHFGGNRREAVERCYLLHCEPPRELTDDEIDEINDSVYLPQDGFTERTPEVLSLERAALRKAMAAFIEKQREPETATFRAARHKKDSQVTFIRYDLPTQLGVSYEWLDHDGKPQTFEVKV